MALFYSNIPTYVFYITLNTRRTLWSHPPISFKHSALSKGSKFYIMHLNPTPYPVLIYIIGFRWYLSQSFYFGVITLVTDVYNFFLYIYRHQNFLVVQTTEKTLPLIDWTTKQQYKQNFTINWLWLIMITNGRHISTKTPHYDIG